MIQSAKRLVTSWTSGVRFPPVSLEPILSIWIRRPIREATWATSYAGPTSCCQDIWQKYSFADSCSLSFPGSIWRQDCAHFVRENTVTSLRYHVGSELQWNPWHHCCARRVLRDGVATVCALCAWELYHVIDSFCCMTASLPSLVHIAYNLRCVRWVIMFACCMFGIM
jgi:hypothetical protein